ncbi:beta-lactamase family protein [Arthrobacter crystallopoietes]|nr:beta-lactamase family protein [Arthrobacter crystallopoietes]
MPRSSSPRNRSRGKLFPALCLAAAALLCATGCTSGGPPQSMETVEAEPVTPAEASGGATSKTQSVEVAATTLRPVDGERLRGIFESMAGELLVPGAVMLLRTPEDELTFTYGTDALDGSEPVMLEDHVRIGSITKTWTGTVILQLVQEGKLKLDDPVSKYRDDVPNGENITIEQLLNMRSGLYNYSESYELNLALDETPERVWTPEELLDIALPLPVYFPPGEGYHYSNTNTVLLGLIAEELDGKPLAEIVQDRILEPLDLTESTFPPSDSTPIPSPHPRGYMFMNNVMTIASTKLPADLIAQAQEGTLEPQDVTDENASWTWAAGQGTSTAGDLADWAEALAGGGILNEEMQKTRLDSLQPVNPDDPNSLLYGLAIAKFGELYGHTGELPGFNSFAGHDPGNDLTLVVWTNLAPAADGRDPAAAIARELIGELYAPAGTPDP